MFKFTVLYRRVDDETSLDTFFSETHLPLSEQLPGLIKSEVGRITGKPGGQSRYHMMYELYFASEKEFALALASPPGQQLMAALKPWADAKLLNWFYSDSYEEAAHPKP